MKETISLIPNTWILPQEITLSSNASSFKITTSQEYSSFKIVFSGIKPSYESSSAVPKLVIDNDTSDSYSGYKERTWGGTQSDNGAYTYNKGVVLAASGGSNDKINELPLGEIIIERGSYGASIH